MAEIEEAVKAYLLTKTGLTALVSTRVILEEVSDGLALPCVVYKKISNIPMHTLGGQLKTESPIFQYSAYATTKPAAMAIKNQLLTALCDYTGTLSGLTIQWIKLLSEYSTKDSQSGAFIEDLEFQIFYNKE